jgi:hypothetical protein
MIGAVMVFANVMFFNQIGELRKIENIYGKSTDRMAPIFLVLAVFINLIASLGFGKPHTAIAISGIGALLSVAFCVKYPGLWEWSEKHFMILTTLGVGMHFFGMEFDMVVNLNAYFFKINFFYLLFLSLLLLFFFFFFFYTTNAKVRYLTTNI